MYTKEEVKNICLDIFQKNRNISRTELISFMNQESFFCTSGMDSLDEFDCVFRFEQKLGIELTEEKFKSMRPFSLSQVLDAIANEYVTQSKSNDITPKKRTTIPDNQYSGLRTSVDNKPYCKLLDTQCNATQAENHTHTPYCEFIKCQLYRNFQKLR